MSSPPCLKVDAVRRRWRYWLVGALLLAGVAAGAPALYRLAPMLKGPEPGAQMVVLLHGLGRQPRAMLQLEGALRGAGYDVRNIGYPSTQAEPAELVEVLHRKLTQCCQASEQAVHYVGHSLGGLMIRAYLGANRQLPVGRVVLIGTPNAGSELADAHRHGELTGALLERAGPTAQALSTGPDGFPASLPPPHYEVGVIAGTRGNAMSDRWLPKPNDGLVSLSSAKLAGMSDMVTLSENHWGLRNAPEVGAQVVAFLRSGAFAPSP